MVKRIILFLLLISIFANTGCGGGGGKKYNTPVLGTIQGTVSINKPSPSNFISMSNSTIKLGSFAKTSIRQAQIFEQSVPNEKIVKIRPESASRANEIITEMGGTIKQKLYGTDATYLITINEQAYSKSAARHISGVEYIEDNLIFRAFDIPNDPYFIYPYFWNYNMLNLQAAWNNNFIGTPDTIVAVLDTGISLSHPDLRDNLILNCSADFVGVSNNLEPTDLDPSDIEYLNEANRLSHGTHVAGIISAVAKNNIGMFGVAWNVKIMPIRVLNSNGMGTATDIAEGINWAVKKGAKVINLSLGSFETSETVKNEIDNAVAAGVTVVAAAGNDGIGSVAFPANYDEKVIAVSSLDQTCTIASYSNYGPEIDFCAPGGSVPLTQIESEWAVKTILSTTYDKKTGINTYAYMSGTSQATPHISGLVALLYAQNPDI